MKLYFSGIQDNRTLRWLESAGVSNILLNPQQMDRVNPSPRAGVVQDSPAYAEFKSGRAIYTVETYAAHVKEQQRRFAEAGHKLDFAVNYDVIGDPEESIRNWARLTGLGLKTVPVWHPAAGRRQLDAYLLCSEIVGLGGIAPAMHEKDEEVLQLVLDLCKIYPNRFHGFGFSDLKAISILKPYLWSLDTSKFLDGARRRLLIRRDSTGERLVAEQRRDLSAEELCIRNARNMQSFVQGVPEPAADAVADLPAPARPVRSYSLDRSRKFVR